jgi:hypothetical protein
MAELQTSTAGSNLQRIVIRGHLYERGNCPAYSLTHHLPVPHGGQQDTCHEPKYLHTLQVEHLVLVICWKNVLPHDGHTSPMSVSAQSDTVTGLHYLHVPWQPLVDAGVDSPFNVPVPQKGHDT